MMYPLAKETSTNWACYMGKGDFRTTKPANTELSAQIIKLGIEEESRCANQHIDKKRRSKIEDGVESKLHAERRGSLERAGQKCL